MIERQQDLGKGQKPNDEPALTQSGGETLAHIAAGYATEALSQTQEKRGKVEIPSLGIEITPDGAWKKRGKHHRKGKRAHKHKRR